MHFMMCKSKQYPTWCRLTTPTRRQVSVLLRKKVLASASQQQHRAAEAPGQDKSMQECNRGVCKQAAPLCIAFFPVLKYLSLFGTTLQDYNELESNIGLQKKR